MPHIFARWSLFACFVVLASLAPRQWAAARADEPATGFKFEGLSAIQETIALQIEAFRRDDGETAYSYAAPEVREAFPDAAAFIAMVRRAYVPIYRPRFFFFGPLSGNDAVAMQEVHFVGPGGGAWTALYRMVRQPDGTWRIAAVLLARGSGGRA